MSTTLTNGLKLPDKGSVDWYADMQSNYAILDGAVGTVAEHTTALAGKAPAVHTHTKSDVTDLFNSANTWSGLNTYSNGQIKIKSQSQEIGVIPSSSVIQYLEFADKNDAQYGKIGLWNYDNGASEIQASISDKYKNGAKDPTGTLDTAFLSFGFQYNGTKFITFSGQVNNFVIPLANNTYDLGSSSYQWNNLYAKNYFYNGVAWGLDKYNQWTGVNDFNNLIGLNGAELWFKNSNIEDITTNPSADTGKSIVQIWNKGTTQYCGGIIDGLDTSGTHVFEIVNFGYPLNSTNAYQHRFRFASKRDGTASFYPTYPNVDLGTSTAKWKTLNGINPGALSLPSGGTTENTDWFNVAGDILPTGGNATSFSRATANYFTPAKDGWLALAVRQCSELSVWCEDLFYGISIVAPDASLNRQVVIPVVAGKSYQIIITGNSWVSARLIMPKGNV